MACHSVQYSLTFIMLCEDNVDLRIGRDRDHHAAGQIQAHQFGVDRIAYVLRDSFAQQIPFGERGVRVVSDQRRGQGANARCSTYEEFLPRVLPV